MFKFATLLLISTVAVTESTLRGASSKDDSHHRKLQVQKTVTGKCTVANFAAAVGASNLAGYLGTTNATEQQNRLNQKCADALQPKIDLSDAIGKGPQFLKNFLDGGTTWNDHYEANGKYVLSEDAKVIDDVYTTDAKTSVFASPDGGTSEHYPYYFSNFYRGNQECRLGVIECCYTSSRKASKPFSGNADMCALDMTAAAKSNHIKAKSMTIYDTKSQDQAYCSGFAYENGSFGDAVKYNTLFHMAMKTNLYDEGLVRNIPGAPLCGCAEQMPIIDNAKCIKAVEGYTMDSNGNVGVSISWDDCGSDLATYYDSLDRTATEKYFVHSQIVERGQCAAAAKSFLNDQMLVSI